MLEWIYLWISVSYLIGATLSKKPLSIMAMPTLRKYLKPLDKFFFRMTGTGVSWNLVLFSFLIGWWVTELAPQLAFFHWILMTFSYRLGFRKPYSKISKISTLIVQLSMFFTLTIYLLSFRTFIQMDNVLKRSLGKDYKSIIAKNKSKSQSVYGNLMVEMFQLITVIPFIPYPQVETVTNIVYDRKTNMKLDIIYHRSKAPNSPVIIYIHGGSWITGTKEQRPPLLKYLAARECVCLSINYRLAPRYSFPSMIIDVKKAIRWAKVNISEYGGNPNFILMCGGSAGGHLATLAALTNNYAPFQPGFELEDTTVQGCISFYGVYNLFYQDNPDLTSFWEKIIFKKKVSEIPDLFHFASPLNHITPQSPPCFIIHGLPDSLVPSGLASEFVSIYRNRSPDPRKIVYAKLPDAHHGFDLTFSTRTWAVNRAVHDWIRFWEIDSTTTTKVPLLLPPTQDIKQNQNVSKL